MEEAIPGDCASPLQEGQVLSTDLLIGSETRIQRSELLQNVNVSSNVLRKSWRMSPYPKRGTGNLKIDPDPKNPKTDVKLTA